MKIGELFDINNYYVGIEMIGRNNNNCYLMSDVQFEEMKEFYKKLGYSPLQVKVLSERCFGNKIVAKKNYPYNDDWCFSLQNDFDMPFPSKLFKNLPSQYAVRYCPPMSGSAINTEMSQMQAKSLVSCDMSAPIGLSDSADSSDMPDFSFLDSAETDGHFTVYRKNNVGRSKKMNLFEDSGAMTEGVSETFSTAETHVNDENETHSPMDNPQAIFSANVNTASWDYLRGKIEQKSCPDKSFVRVEEIINSYVYDFPKPENDELFSLSAETSKCPWNTDAELMLVGMRAKEVNVDVKQNLVFLIDVSGSMEDQWILVQMSLAAIISRMKENDVLSIITYSNKTTVVKTELNGGDKAKCVDALISIEGIGGCTRGSEGLEQAYKFLQDKYDKNANNRVFIFTDGDFNFGITSEGELKDFIYKKRESGIYLSIVGYGYGNFKDDKMETLAYNGNGNYTFVSNPYDIYDNLCDKLISNLVTVAKDVKISVELNPVYVSSYRLIGYEFRALTQQEFHDTKKATDGIGSGHNVVALIEFTRGKAQEQFSSRYVTSNVKEHTDEFAFIEVHYKSTDDENLTATKSISVKEIENSQTDNIKIAQFLAAFGLCVIDSKYKGKADKNMLSEMLREFERSGKYDMNKKYSHFDVIRKFIQR